MLKWSHMCRKSASTVSSLRTNFHVLNFQRCKHAFQPLYARCLLYNCTFQGTVLWDEKCSLCFCVFYVLPEINWVGTEATFVGLRNKLDIWTCSWNETYSYVGDLLYMKRLQVVARKILLGKSCQLPQN